MESVPPINRILKISHRSSHWSAPSVFDRKIHTSLLRYCMSHFKTPWFVHCQLSKQNFSIVFHTPVMFPLFGKVIHHLRGVIAGNTSLFTKPILQILYITTILYSHFPIFSYISLYFHLFLYIFIYFHIYFPTFSPFIQVFKEKNIPKWPSAGSAGTVFSWTRWSGCWRNDGRSPLCSGSSGSSVIRPRPWTGIEVSYG